MEFQLVLFFSTILLMLTITARAETVGIALTTAAADTASTAVALSKGLTELNPLGFAGTVAMKVAAIAYIKQLPEEEHAASYGIVSSFWGGATANNLCWLTGAGPFCMALGIVTALYLWDSGAEERIKERPLNAQTAYSRR
jgi:hypothetical protein